MSQHEKAQLSSFPTPTACLNQKIRFCSNSHCCPLFSKDQKKINERGFQHICSFTIIVHNVDYVWRSTLLMLLCAQSYIQRSDAWDVWWQKHPHISLWNIHIYPVIPTSNRLLQRSDFYLHFPKPHGVAELSLRGSIYAQVSKQSS